MTTKKQNPCQRSLTERPLIEEHGLLGSCRQRAWEYLPFCAKFSAFVERLDIVLPQIRMNQLGMALARFIASSGKLWPERSCPDDAGKVDESCVKFTLHQRRPFYFD
jgi:hypothetical protein